MTDLIVAAIIASALWVALVAGLVAWVRAGR